MGLWTRKFCPFQRVSFFFRRIPPDVRVEGMVGGGASLAGVNGSNNVSAGGIMGANGGRQTAQTSEGSVAVAAGFVLNIHENSAKAEIDGLTTYDEDKNPTAYYPTVIEAVRAPRFVEKLAHKVVVDQRGAERLELPLWGKHDLHVGSSVPEIQILLAFVHRSELIVVRIDVITPHVR